jgi:hypothetical protein
LSTPIQLVDQIAGLLAELRVQVAPALRITTAAELELACNTGGNYELAPGVYNLNAIVTKPLTLSGGRDAVLQPVDVFEPTLSIFSSNVAVKGITVKGSPRNDRECVVVGKWDATTAAEQPSNVLLDGLAVTAGLSGGHRGISLHGSYLTVSNSRITGFWEPGRDSQGIWGNNGPGPYTIIDNVIEASGENILFGGSDPRIPNVIPSDIFVARNVLRKPEIYAALGATNKNAFELKNARRVKFTENTIENFVPNLSQDGLIQLTPRNQDGNAPWCNVEDVEISKNIVRGATSGFAVNMLGTDNEQPSAQMRNIRISGNLFLTNKGFQVLGGIADGLVIEHNTLPLIVQKLFSFSGITGMQPVITALSFVNNVAKGGEYPITGDGNQSVGLQSLMAFNTITAWSGNVIEDGGNWTWPAGQTVLPAGGLAPLLDPTTYKLLNNAAGY